MIYHPFYMFECNLIFYFFRNVEESNDIKNLISYWKKAIYYQYHSKMG